MNLYPAMRASMGRWTYFVVKMTMRELAEQVKFGAAVYEDRTLDEAIQRELMESRVKRDIVTYLVRQPDRFFSSVVVAALEGNPQWYPISIEDDERFRVFRGDAKLNDSFGILSFDGTQDYYALDGQHRLAAIKALVDSKSDVAVDAPKGFKKEEMSVIVVVPDDAESHQDFMERYRRLFGNLNRYAKVTDHVTNIIMDEDDVFAIITRRLITDHEFFRAPGRHKDSVRIKMRKGKNLKSSDPFVTSLEALYEINIRLLSTSRRKNAGWDVEGTGSDTFRRFRPADDVIDSLFEELKLYWDALLKVLPVLRQSPPDMRHHASADGLRDHVLFWPIGQELMADVARDLLDHRQGRPEAPDRNSIARALSGLSRLQWDFHSPPWRHLLLIPTNEEMTAWRIRSEERKECQLIARQIINWQIGLDELTAEEMTKLREDWELLLLPALTADRVDELWTSIEEGVMR